MCWITHYSVFCNYKVQLLGFTLTVAARRSKWKLRITKLLILSYFFDFRQ